MFRFDFDHLLTTRSNTKHNNYVLTPCHTNAHTLTVDVARSINAFARGSRRPVASSAGPLKVVVDLLIVVDNKLYRRTLQRQNTTKDAHNYIKKYYRYVVTLVSQQNGIIRSSMVY